MKIEASTCKHMKRQDGEPFWFANVKKIIDTLKSFFCVRELNRFASYRVTEIIVFY